MRKILFFCLVLAGFSFAQSATKATNLGHIELYQSPFCGCCGMWVKYMQSKGYTLTVHKDNDAFMKVKERMGIKDEYQSCHTGLINGYALEGHLPADAVAWLLKEKPKDVIGISVPGMPMGSPGMEQGGEEDEYPVVIMLKGGGYKLYGIYKGHKLIKKG